MSINTIKIYNNTKLKFVCLFKADRAFKRRRFPNLKLIRPIETKQGKELTDTAYGCRYWLCLCKCGKYVILAKNYICNRGNTASCLDCRVDKRKLARKRIYYSFDKKSYTVKEWADKLCLNYHAMYDQLRHNDHNVAKVIYKLFQKRNMPKVIHTSQIINIKIK